MTALALFCFGSVLFLAWRDLLLDHTRDVEVWFGFEVRGRAALLTAPLHWIAFAIGAWGFWFQRPWILPCAAAYSFYVAFCHLVWNQISPNGYGLLSGLAQTVVFSLPGVFFWRAHRRSMRAEPTPVGRTL